MRVLLSAVLVLASTVSYATFYSPKVASQNAAAIKYREQCVTMAAGVGVNTYCKVETKYGMFCRERIHGDDDWYRFPCKVIFNQKLRSTKGNWVR